MLQENLEAKLGLDLLLKRRELGRIYLAKARLAYNQRSRNRRKLAYQDR